MVIVFHLRSYSLATTWCRNSCIGRERRTTPPFYLVFLDPTGRTKAKWTGFEPVVEPSYRNHSSVTGSRIDPHSKQASRARLLFRLTSSDLKTFSVSFFNDPRLDIWQVKFGDEKSFNGEEVYNHRLPDTARSNHSCLVFFRMHSKSWLVRSQPRLLVRPTNTASTIYNV